MRAAIALISALAAAALLSACGEEGGDQPESEPAAESSAGSSQRFPDVIDVEATESEPGVYDLAVTISSPYDSPERYADGWRVLDGDGNVIAEHELLHDHASEQPFTRVQDGVEIPAGTKRIVVEGRDLANGFGGERFELELDGG